MSLLDQLFNILPKQYEKSYRSLFQNEGFEDEDVFEAYLDQKAIAELIHSEAHAQTIYIFMQKVGEENNL